LFRLSPPKISPAKNPPYNPITVVELSFQLWSHAIVALRATSGKEHDERSCHIYNGWNWQTIHRALPDRDGNLSSRPWVPSGWNRATKCLQARKNLPKKKISAFVLFSATVVVLWWVGSQGSLLSFKRCTGKQTDGWQSWNESLTILIGLHGEMLVTGKIPCALVWSQWWQMIAQKGLLPLALNLVWYDAFRGELSFVFYLSTANVSDHAKQTNLRESK